MKLRMLVYPFAVLASLAITVFAMLFVNWWAPLFANSTGNLPAWLYWFQTFDAGLDAGWQDGYLSPSWGGDAVAAVLGASLLALSKPRLWIRLFRFWRSFCPCSVARATVCRHSDAVFFRRGRPGFQHRICRAVW